MKHTRVTALAAVSLAAALSLTACSGEGSGKDSSAKGASTPSSDASASSSSPSDGGSDSGGSTANDTKPDSSGQDAQAGTGTGSTKGASKAGAKVTFCKTADLAIDAVDAAPDKTSGRINITMINRGSTTCSATGFAGVDIKDADHTSNPIERGPAQPRITILKPGDTAIFDLAYTIDATGNSLSSPTDILVTPPNETHTVSLDWPAAAGQIKGAYTDVQVYPTHTTK
ncbi:DUF4232 domain-containing protein [Streptomyces sp. NBC_00198]|uniref:DUF4232 domain-containing protein n=1 Tax=Streptomyces sp. NBC_00198 TaxID=2975677 RepID=UPI0022515685|nr:DUF4232 domain-containing protein [Streptomyces sp. NBC_00198]MCX5280768.1 DUF4232 domain-containing protein [Streptomyces sp. NBC_00198]